MNLDQLPSFCLSDSNDFIPKELAIEDNQMPQQLTHLIGVGEELSYMPKKDFINDMQETGTDSKDFEKAYIKVFQSNINSNTNDLELEENKVENHLPNKKKFIVKEYQNRGRKKDLLKRKRETHHKTDDDNVTIKLQVHFFVFLINLSNDILNSSIKTKDYAENNINFRQIQYKYKSNITKEYVKQLKRYQIKDILQKEISCKGNKYEINYNKINYEKITELISKDKSLFWIKNFFDMNYLDVFLQFYYKFTKEKSIMIQGKEILLSKDTKTFYDLLEKNEKSMKKRLITISERYLIREKNIFKTNIKKEL